jgi:hypothetical protein
MKLEFGNTIDIRLSRIHTIKALRELAQERGFKLRVWNSGREFDIYKPIGRAGSLIRGRLSFTQTTYFLLTGKDMH